MTTKIYGYSDDTVTVEGDEITEEFDVYQSGSKVLLVFSNGVMLRIATDDEDGMWHITVLRGHDKITITPATDPDDNYSDTGIINEPIEWVVHGKQLVTAKG